jgi:thiol-disulfide isomerase/thioredoxin
VTPKSEQKQRLWTPVRLALTFVVLSLFAAFGVSSCNSDEGPRVSQPNADTAPARPNNPAAPAPPAVITLPPGIMDVELKAVTGGPIKLSNYQGKVFVVNLWATWCGPCRVEIPELVKLYTENRKRGLEVVGLSTENPEASAEKVRQFVQDFDINYRVGWATPEVAIALMQGRDAIPQSFVIGRDGRVVRRFVGFNPASTPALLKQAVEDALKQD